MVEILLACILLVLLLPFLPLILAGVGAAIRVLFLVVLAGLAIWFVAANLPTVGLAALAVGATVALGYGIAVGVRALSGVIAARRG